MFNLRKEHICLIFLENELWTRVQHHLFQWTAISQIIPGIIKIISLAVIGKNRSYILRISYDFKFTRQRIQDSQMSPSGDLLTYNFADSVKCSIPPYFFFIRNSEPSILSRNLCNKIQRLQGYLQNILH